MHKPDLIDAMEAVIELARIQVDSTGEHEVEFNTVYDFTANHWDEIESRFGAEDAIANLEEDGAYPEMEIDELPQIDSTLGRAMPAVLAAALEAAREHPEIEVEEFSFDALESINMTASFWTIYGLQVCEALVEIDIGDFSDTPSM